MKYKIWDKKKQEYVDPVPGTHCYSFWCLSQEGFPVHLVGNYQNNFLSDEEVESELYEIRPFIGVVDSAEEEIYAGDKIIVKIAAEEFVFRVKYDHGNLQWKFYDENSNDVLTWGDIKKVAQSIDLCEK